MFSIKRLFGRNSSAQERSTTTARTVDIRSDAERATAQRAQSPLDAPNERVADMVTALSLLVEAMQAKPAAEQMLQQLEGYLEKPGGISKQELDALIAAERSKLKEAEDAIQVLTTWLQSNSVSVSTPEECNSHITKWGRQLNETGGQELMELVAYRCHARGARLVYIQAAWDGVGSWRS